jgi:polyhydroxyalkanoate synthesis regulator phasin
VAGELKQALYMFLGFIDYAREKFEDLREEFIERGEGKGEDLREFLDDVLENIPIITRQDKKEEDEDIEFDEQDTDEEPGLLGYYNLTDIKDRVSNLVDRLGLASHSDIEDLHEKLDRLQETVKNLIRK